MVSTLDFESNNPSSILGMSFLFLCYHLSRFYTPYSIVLREYPSFTTKFRLKSVKPSSLIHSYTLKDNKRKNMH